MGDLIELWFFMLLIACVAFAPLGYFIYMYTMKNGEPFGDIEPHGDSESAVLNVAEKLINKVKDAINKNVNNKK
ncbi:MAG: hypothetical protein ACU836_15145 [Gammaproteobacteria bacterium]